MPAALATDSRSPSPPATVSSGGTGARSRCTSSPDPPLPTSRSTAPRTRSGTALAANLSRGTSVAGCWISASHRGPKGDRRVSLCRRPPLACSGSSHSRLQPRLHVPESSGSISSPTPPRERKCPSGNAIPLRLAYAKYSPPFLSTDSTSAAPSSPPTRSAIAFERLHPGDAGLIGKPVGGKDTGRYDSLAEYFANQLSRRIDKGTITDIEGRSLDGRFLKCLQYDNRGDTVTSSLGQANMSIFRLAPPERQLAGSRGRPPSSLRGASSH